MEANDGYEDELVDGEMDEFMQIQVQLQALVCPIPFIPSSLFSSIFSSSYPSTKDKTPKNLLPNQFEDEDEEEDEGQDDYIDFVESLECKLLEEDDYYSSRKNEDPYKADKNYAKKVVVNRKVISNVYLYGTNPRVPFEGATAPTHMDFESFHENLRRSSVLTNLRNKCKCNPLKLLLSIFPILNWLPNYNWKQDITFDLMAGFTVAVMHIPQGMAYAQLANLPPIIGIYMGFFPVIIYSLLGTSRHISIGTFAVICLMTGKVALEKLGDYPADHLGRNMTRVPGILTLDFSSLSGYDQYFKYNLVQIATAISFTVGICQVIMGIFRMGFLTVLLSAELVNGFTTGAAFHVLTSQLKSLFGIPVAGRDGIFKVPLMWYDIGKNLEHLNITALILSTVTIISLLVYNELLKPLLGKFCRFPLPVELITIVIGTTISVYWDFKDRFGIAIIDHIPTGMPTPVLPPVEIFPDLVMDSILIAVVAYVISVSMAKIFAVKHDYTIEPNQELLANGASNIVGSCFSCAPVSASLSRSLIQDQVGGRTQLAGLFSCLILVAVLLWIGPFFQTLPSCILSSMIVVALKGMMAQILDLPHVWRLSYLNGMIWIITFCGTIILDIEYGLGIGVIFSITLLIWRSNKPLMCVLGSYDNTDVYVDIRSSVLAKELPGIRIVRYTGSLNFATVEKFVMELTTIVPFSGELLLTESMSLNLLKRYKMFPYGLLRKTASKEKINHNISTEDNLDYHTNQPMLSYLILDLSGISTIDIEAVKNISYATTKYLNNNIKIFICGCSSQLLETMSKCGFIEHIGGSNFYPTVHDAVVVCSDDIRLPSSSSTPSTSTSNNSKRNRYEKSIVASEIHDCEYD